MYIIVKLHKYNLKICATKAEYACNYIGLNVEHMNNRIINTVPCVNSCKLDKYNYIHVFHTDNIGLDLHIGNLDYEI